MKATEFIEVIIKQLITPSSEIEVCESVNGDRVTIFIQAPKAERGKIIGKRGETISALKVLLVAKAASEGDNRFFILKVID